MLSALFFLLHLPWLAPVAYALPQSCGTPSSSAAGTSPSDATNISTPTHSGNGTWWKPGCSDTFLWSLDTPTPLGSVVSDTGLSIIADNYGVDLFTTTTEQIKAYHDEGKHVICYFTGGVYEEWSPDRGNFTSSCYCDKQPSCALAGWPNWWLDIHSPACVENVQSVIRGRIELAKSKGCDAVDPDNVDAWTYKLNYGITAEDQLNHLMFLSDTAHENGLAVTLKNSPGMVKLHQDQIINAFDFPVSESCNVWNECDVFQPFVGAGKPVVQIEYEGSISCTRPGYAVSLNTRKSLSYKLVKDMCHSPCPA